MRTKLSYGISNIMNVNLSILKHVEDDPRVEEVIQLKAGLVYSEWLSSVDKRKLIIKTLFIKLWVYIYLKSSN